MYVVTLLFWHWREGRIGRVAFAATSLAIWAVLYGVQLLLPAPLEEDVTVGSGGATVAALLAMVVLAVLALVATLNLGAKRFRDMGLPGWLATIGVTLLNGALIYAVPTLAYPWFAIAVFALLALTPSGILSIRA